MSINTTTLQVYPLRGMDQRYFAKPNKAELIQDMTWNSQDSWMHAGGFSYIVRDYTFYEIPAGSAEENTDVESQYNQGQRNKPVQNTPHGSGLSTNAYKNSTEKAPISLHWFAQTNGAIQWLVYETVDGELKYFNGSKAPITPSRYMYNVDGTIYDGSNANYSRTVVDQPWPGTHFQTFASRVYMVNGYDEPLVFDGLKVTRAGFAGPAPQVEAEISQGTINKTLVPDTSQLGVGFSRDSEATKFAYRYKVTFVNERGQESPASDVATLVQSSNPASKKRLVTVILPKGPSGTVARRIYRTQDVRDSEGILRVRAFGSEFYFLKEVQDNVTVFFVDGRKDTQLASLLDEDQLGEFPTSTTMMASFKNTMFLCGENTNQIRFSYPRAPEVFPTNNLLDIGDADSGPITGMYTTKNALVIFKSKGVYLVKGDPANGFFTFTLTRDVGCIASKSIREVPGQGLIFMSYDGVYLLEGALEDTGTITGITRLSQPIDEEFKRINLSAARTVRSVLNSRDGEYWLVVPLNGDVVANHLLKFHWEIGEWSVSPNFFVAEAVETRDHRNYVVIANRQPLAKGLHVYSRAYDTKGVSAFEVTPMYRTIHLAMKGLYSSFALVRLQVSAIGYGNNDLTANIYTNRDISTAYSSSLSRDQKRPLEDFSAPVYGTTTWDQTNTYWAKHRPITVRFDLSTMHKGPVNELAFELQPVGKRIQIIGYQAEARVGTRREVVNLTEVYGGSITR